MDPNEERGNQTLVPDYTMREKLVKLVESDEWVERIPLVGQQTMAFYRLFAFGMALSISLMGAGIVAGMVLERSYVMCRESIPSINDPCHPAAELVWDEGIQRAVCRCPVRP